MSHHFMGCVWLSLVLHAAAIGVGAQGAAQYDVMPDEVSFDLLIVSDIVAEAAAANVTVEQTQPQPEQLRAEPRETETMPQDLQAKIQDTEPDATIVPPTGAELIPVPAVPMPTQVGLGAAQARPSEHGNKPPLYPRVARLRGWEGRVEVRVTVGPDGRVRNTRVVSSSGYASLDKAAREAIAQWQLRPAQRLGTPVMSDVDVPIRFLLQEQHQEY